jgi:hypothetical protein
MNESNNVSFIAYEAAGARYERINKRLAIVCFLNTLAMLACIIINHQKEN